MLSQHIQNQLLFILNDFYTIDRGIMYYLLALLAIITTHTYAASHGPKSRSLRNRSAISDSSVATPKLPFFFVPTAVQVTDAKVTVLLDQYIRTGDSTLFDAFQIISTRGGIQKLCDADMVLMRGAEHTLQKITAKKNIADLRAIPLAFQEQQQSVSARSDAWQVYHMAIINELKPFIEDNIPDTTVYTTDLSITYNNRTYA